MKTATSGSWEQHCLTVFAIIGVGAILGLWSSLCFASPAWNRRHSWVLQVQAILIAVLMYNCPDVAEFRDHAKHPAADRTGTA